MSQLEHKIISDPCASRWLKNQIVETKERDIVDVINETEALLFILKQRFHNNASCNLVNQHS